MSQVGKGGRYPDELRERAVRMVFEHAHEYPSQWKAIVSIGEKLGVHRESLRTWVRRAEVDQGHRPGLTTDERTRIRELERENKELRRANEMARLNPPSTCRSATRSDSPRTLIVASVGSKGDSYDNALAESFNGIYKWELIHRRGPWRGLDDVEFETLTYVDWFNHRRLHGELAEHGYVTPAEFEDDYYRQNVTASEAATK